MEIHALPPDDGTPRIRQYRRLGRTEAMVSDIGSGEPSSSSVLRAVLDSGVNFIETSESYGNGRNETMIGDVIREFDREKLFIATKAFPAMKFFKSEDDVLRRAEGSLQRLQSAYIDLYMIHQAQNLFRVKDNYFHRAADRLKKQGKIRFTGLSCHGPEWAEGSLESLEDILMAAIEDGRFDVILLPYNFLAHDVGARIIRACKDHDIGTMIMKSNPILTYENYTDRLERSRELARSEQKYYDGLVDAMKDAEDFLKKYNMTDLEDMKDGAIQFILTNPDAHTICCRFNTFNDVHKYVRLSGTTLDDRLALVLDEFRNKLGYLNCRIGCSLCEKACPHKVPVSSIMRCNYYMALGMLERARRFYRKLNPSQTIACKNCPGPCEKACPFMLPVGCLLAGIHEDLGDDRGLRYT
jgi:predicted aldo/keto reductase-like oxidoreductase